MPDGDPWGGEGEEPPELVIRGGLVATSSWVRRATIEVRAGRIASLSSDRDLRVPQGIAEVDASGMWVLPGGVDPHVHLNMSLGSEQTQDSAEELVHAALRGGTTTLLIHAIPHPGVELPITALERLRKQMDRTGSAYVLHACIPGWVADPIEELRRCYAFGARTVKLFTTYPGLLMVDDEQLLALLNEAHRLGMRVLIHAEANDIISSSSRQLDACPAEAFPRTRPEQAEIIAVKRALAAARRSGATVYFVHLSTPDAVDLVSAAAQDGIAALAETCPHYLLLDDSAYGGEYGERYLCCPPLRSRSTMAALRRELVAGRIDAIGSDHCCYRLAQKLVGRSAAPDAPMGLPGVDLRNVLILDLVARGELRLELAVRVLAEIPAKFAGIFPQKGIVAPGADADLVLWDPKSSWVIGSPAVATASDYTPFEGHNVSVAPRYVFRKGRCVARDGEVASPQSDSKDGFLVSAGHHGDLICGA